MESLQKLEVMVAAWYKDMPHMPENGRKWLATNAWWIVLVGTILGAIGLSSAFMGLMIAGAMLVGFGGAVGAAITGIAFLAVTVSLAFSILDIVLGAIAISPLKAQRKRGWDLLFLIMLLNVVAALVAFLFGFNVFQLVWTLLFTAVGAYFLFEARPYFHESAKVKQAVAASHERKKHTSAEG